MTSTPYLVKQQILGYNGQALTRLLTANIGSYPRIGELKDQQRHRRGMTHFLNKDISAHAFRDVVQSVIHEVIHEQVQAGIDEVTDGLISWQDPISHLCAKMSGFKITGLNRYFDENFYYRRPVITAKPKRKDPLIVDEFLFAKGLSGKPIRMVLTGPLTLAVHTEAEIKPYDKLETRIQFFTDVLAEEIGLLSAKGASIVQIDEPSLLTHPQEFPYVQQALNIFSKKAKPGRLALAVYYSSALPLINKLLSLPVDSLNLDLTLDNKKVFEKIMDSNTLVPIGFGLLNARSTKLEPIDPILDQLSDWLEKTASDTCTVTPSAGLESLPRDYALAKLKLLSKIKDELQQTVIKSGSM